MPDVEPTFDSMLLDPAAAFDTPEAVLSRTGLTSVQKIEILRRWDYDVREQEVAEEEGMLGPRGDMLDRIHAALATLGAEPDLDHEPPTKQGGI